MPGKKHLVRCIGLPPGLICFKPCGRPRRRLETLVLRLDELEALRLADLEGLYQEECARRMGVSRTTFSRTLSSARRKVSDALINGKCLIADGRSEIRGSTPEPAVAERTSGADERPPGQAGDSLGGGGETV